MQSERAVATVSYPHPRGCFAETICWYNWPQGRGNCTFCPGRTHCLTRPRRPRVRAHVFQRSPVSQTLQTAIAHSPSTSIHWPFSPVHDLLTTLTTRRLSRTLVTRNAGQAAECSVALPRPSLHAPPRDLRARPQHHDSTRDQNIRTDGLCMNLESSSAAWRKVSLTTFGRYGRQAPRWTAAQR